MTFPQEQRRTAAVDAGRGAGGSEACAPGSEGGVREAPEGLGQGAGAAVAAGQGGVAEGRAVAQLRLGGGQALPFRPALERLSGHRPEALLERPPREADFRGDQIEVHRLAERGQHGALRPLDIAARDDV